ncbi:hypothetical protein HYV30_03920 [Candidatus Kaiserbacteria bacterium]|nr:hypothetical protein [Candidatus Kaiserbacteria bacterium]
MGYFIFILISLALLAGFHCLVWYENRRTVRVLETHRTLLDRQVERVEFILTHVDLAAFAKEEAGRLAARIGHDLARLSLIAIRAVERILTRFVRDLRTRHLGEDYARPRESAREFVKTLSNFKDHLEATRPEMPPL